MEKGGSSSKKSRTRTFKNINQSQVKSRFFESINCPSVQLRKLRLPPAFTKDNDITLSGHAYLKAPGGREYKVTIVRKDGDLWLKEGWSTFCQSYSIANGHSLIFRYLGNSRFKVSIFGLSSLEINYPVFVFDTSSDDEDLAESERDEEESDTESDYEDLALEKAEAFNSDKPRFVIKMTEHYMRDHRVYIPKCHVEKFIPTTKTEVHLRHGRRHWSVSITRCGRSTRLCNGWKEFKSANDLRVNDACVFELVHVELIYEVHIFRC